MKLNRKLRKLFQIFIFGTLIMVKYGGYLGLLLIWFGNIQNMSLSFLYVDLAEILFKIKMIMIICIGKKDAR
ncbi:hypothetical protein D7X87_11985 [bacterium D16-54]|nr:hypothetical protein D7X87_11985 [bacterium D16-54]RKJ14260.1 hypothetical protein D7X65_12580 [bacterium D16-56]